MTLLGLKRKVIIEFRGNRYNAMTIKNNLKNAPWIGVKSSELHDNFPNLVGNYTDSEHLDVGIKEDIFVKFEGKYVPILGLTTNDHIVKDGVIVHQGRLLSSHMLKRCLA